MLLVGSVPTELVPLLVAVLMSGRNLRRLCRVPATMVIAGWTTVVSLVTLFWRSTLDLIIVVPTLLSRC